MIFNSARSKSTANDKNAGKRDFEAISCNISETHGTLMIRGVMSNKSELSKEDLERLEDATNQMKLSGDTKELFLNDVRKCFTITRAKSVEVSIGQSRIGGTPDFPTDIQWPACDKGLLPFLAQIRLEDIKEDSRLPKNGMLYIFIKNRVGGHKVLYSPSTEGLAPAESPSIDQYTPIAGVDDPREMNLLDLEPIPISFKPAISLRHIKPFKPYEPLGLSTEGVEKYYAVAKKLLGKGFDTKGGDIFGQLLGHTRLVGAYDPPEESRAVREIGGSMFASKLWKEKNADKLREQMAKWHSLIRLDSIFSEKGLKFSRTHGKFQITVREDHLADKDFSHTGSFCDT